MKGGGICRSLDVYGKPVLLTFQGNEKFRTAIGGCVTLTVGFILLSFATFNAVKINQMNELTMQTMHQHTFDQIHSTVDLKDVSKPEKKFALRLGR